MEFTLSPPEDDPRRADIIARYERKEITLDQALGEMEAIDGPIDPAEVRNAVAARLAEGDRTEAQRKAERYARLRLPESEWRAQFAKAKAETGSVRSPINGHEYLDADAFIEHIKTNRCVLMAQPEFLEAPLPLQRVLIQQVPDIADAPITASVGVERIANNQPPQKAPRHEREKMLREEFENAVGLSPDKKTLNRDDRLNLAKKRYGIGKDVCDRIFRGVVDRLAKRMDVSAWKRTGPEPGTPQNRVVRQDSAGHGDDDSHNATTGDSSCYSAGSS